MKYKKLEDN